jgi:hypothetical protein
LSGLLAACFAVECAKQSAHLAFIRNGQPPRRTGIDFHSVTTISFLVRYPTSLLFASGRGCQVTATSREIS